MRLRERWINLLYRAATGTASTRALLTPVGVTVFGVFTAAFVLAALLVDELLDLPGLLTEDVRLIVSIPMITIGLLTTAWSVLHFLKPIFNSFWSPRNTKCLKPKGLRTSDGRFEAMRSANYDGQIC